MQIRRRFACLTLAGLVAVGSLTAETSLSTVYGWGGIAVGSVTQPGSTIAMPDVITLPDGSYRMYYLRTPTNTQHYISYADSPDGVTWTPRGDALTYTNDTTSPLYIIGGPRVLRLADGRYRMYFRSTRQFTGVPLYKTFSAISSDGRTFTLEAGVRIDIYPDDPASNLSLAGHGTFYTLADGSFAGIISGNPVPANGPSDLYLCRSPDGLTWTGCTLLYVDLHDPVLVQREGRYYLFASSSSSPTQPQVTLSGISTDGLTWPTLSQLTPLSFSNASGADVSAHVGDVGALVTPAGDIRIFANWGPTVGIGSPSTAIAWWAPVAAAPVISVHPGSVTVSAGQTATLRVSAVGYPTPTFQWRKEGTAISGAATDTLTLSNVRSSDAGSYDVVVTNASGSVTSNAATVTVGPSSCSYTVAPTTATAAVSGSTGTITVATSTACAWTATSNAAWLTVTSGASGSGSGTVGWSAAANAGASRTGTLTVAGYSVTITQFGVTESATVPGPPANLGATMQGSVATLTWEAPTTGGTPSGYVIEIGTTAGGNELSPRPTGSVQTAATLTLTSGRFYVRVRGINQYGQGETSNEVTVTFGGARAAPAPPANLTARVQGASLTLQWSPPPTGDPAAAYIIEAGSAFGQSDIAAVDTGSAQTTMQTSGVPARLYFIRVRGRNAAGRGAASNEVAVRVGPAVCSSAPGSPVLLSATVRQLSVGLSWLPASSGGPATNHVLLAGTQSGAANLGSIDTGSAATSFAGHANAGTYYVRVVARNACGDSPPSNEVRFTPGAPLAAPGAPAAVSGSVSGRTVTLVWAPPASGGAPASYTIYAGSASGLGNLAAVVTGSAATTYTAANVPAGRYYVRVLATNGAGTSAASPEIVVTVP